MRIIRGVLAAMLAGVFIVTPIAITTHPPERQSSISTPVVTAQFVRSAPLAASRSQARAPIDDVALVHHAEGALKRRRAHAVAVALEKRRIYSSSVAWARQPFAVGVANCESGPGPSEPRYDHYVGNAHLIDPNGHDGKWQFAPSTYASVGGIGNAAYASEAEQDYRAWLLWKRDGWSPWECARYV